MPHCVFSPVKGAVGEFRCTICGAVVRGIRSLPIHRECDSGEAVDQPRPENHRVDQPVPLYCSFEPIPDTLDCRCTRCGTVFHDAQPDELVVLCPKEGLGQPPAVYRLLNFGKALGRHWIDMAAKRLAGEPQAAYRTTQEMEAILAKCAKCPLFNGKVCTHVDCGCPITAQKKWFSKLAWASEHCPKDPPEW